MTFSKTFQGAWKVSALVSDRWGTAFLHTEQFMGYTKREAARLYRQSIKEQGFTFV